MTFDAKRFWRAYVKAWPVFLVMMIVACVLAALAAQFGW